MVHFSVSFDWLLLFVEAMTLEEEKGKKARKKRRRKRKRSRKNIWNRRSIRGGRTRRPEMRRRRGGERRRKRKGQMMGLSGQNEYLLLFLLVHENCESSKIFLLCWNSFYYFSFIAIKYFTTYILFNLSWKLFRMYGFHVDEYLKFSIFDW